MADKKTPPMLDIVDCSEGFMKPGNQLYVPGAEETVAPIHAFLDEVNFSVAVVKNDTHFESEYQHSPEAEIFAFHQGYGTAEHNYMIDVQRIQAADSYWLYKNQFDMWAASSEVNVPRDQLVFDDPAEELVYNNLFHMLRIADAGEPQRLNFLEHRDVFYEGVKQSGITDVVLFGHATDYCVRDAVLGYLKRGFKVYLIEDLCRGIWNTEIPGGVANINDLIKAYPILDDSLAAKQLIITTADDYIATYA